MKTMNEVIEELIMLCEVRGELEPEANARNERRIAELNAEYLRLQALEPVVDQ
jgi:anti-sigma factor RsiW